MKRIISITFLLIGVILSGCSANNFVVKDGPANGQSMNMLVTPVQSIGVQATENVSSGNVTVVEGPIADKCIASEMYPGRFRWNGLAMLPDGKELPVQFLLIGMYKSGEFQFAIMVEGAKKVVKDAKVVFLSSKGDYVGNLEGERFQIDGVKFRNEKQYRNEIINRHGSRIGSRREIIDFGKTVLSWNRYSTNQGEIYTPYGDDFIKRIARINPGDNFLDKLVLKGNMTISTSPITTLSSIGLSIIEATFSKSQGWDYMSEIPDRAMMGEIVEFVGRLRLEVIRQLNDENERLSAKTHQSKKGEG